MERRVAFVLLLSFHFLLGCEGEGASGAPPELPYTDFFTPLPEAAIFPDDNSYSESKRTLGEFLFWDPILSGRMNVSCATCHHPDHGWADGRRFSVGVDGSGLGPNRTGSMETPFHSPSVLNVGFAGIFETDPGPGFVSGGYFWDLRADTLEDQAIEPIKNDLEMRSSDFLEEEIMPEIVSRLSLIPQYKDLFNAAFEDPDPISEGNIAKALATYQRTLITQRT